MKRHLLLPALIAAFVAVTSLGSFVAAIPEPFPFLHGCNATAGPPFPHSPDPLVRYRWSPTVNRTPLQLYTANPIKWDAVPPSSFDVSADHNGIASVAVLGAGSLRLDFGTERAAWLEFDSKDLTPEILAYVTCGLSEFNSPLEGKTRQPVSYENGTTFRLETNEELYEGLRYAWINYGPPQNSTNVFHMTSIRVVAKLKPVNYTGAYAASDDTLTSVWYTGAYAVRLNMLADNFGSVLVERGDRVAIQGDGHPTMAAALSAFGPESYELIKSALNKTDSGCPSCHVVDDSIMAYPIYWTMSVNEYFWASGDDQTFKKIVPDIQSILDKAASTFNQRPSLVWMGWDDRLGDGWCGSTCPFEAQLAFASLLVRAHKDFSVSLQSAGLTYLAKKYANIAAQLGSILRNDNAWLDSYELHSAANAINAGLATPSETTILFERELNDVAKVCSLSPFNQYWILQALGNAGRMDHALASIRLCWSGMTRLGRGCFWELYDPQWASIMKAGEKAPAMPSMCHPWSSGVTAWMTKEHVGLQPLEPGYKSFLAAPFVSHLNPSVSGMVGTPFGDLQVSAELQANEVTVTVQASVGGRIGLRLQLGNGCVLVGFRHQQEIEDMLTPSLQVIPPLTSEVVAHEEGFPLPLASQTGSTLGFSQALPSGNHMLVGVYGGCDTTTAHTADNPFAPFPPASYPAATSTDPVTRGNWVGKYGSQGYLLFGFENGTDVSSLPNYVRSVSGYYFWGGVRHNLLSVFRGKSESDITYLEPPPFQNAGERALGSVGAEQSGRGVVLDVNLNENFTDTYRVSLYMAAVNRTDDMAIRAMDLRSLSPMARMPLVQNFNGGVYWSIVCSGGGVRFRIMPRYGAPTVSAFFFDAVA